MLNPYSGPSQPLQLMVVAADATLRARVQSDLQPWADLQVVAEAKTLADALRSLVGWLPGAGIDLVLVDFQMNAAALPSELTVLQFCQALKARSPQLPILLLASPHDANLSAALHQGIEGCCGQDSSVSELMTAIRQVAAGQCYWPPEGLSGAPLTQPPLTQSEPRAPLIHNALNVLPTAWHHLRREVRHQGLDQIDAALMTIAVQLRSPAGTPIDRWFLRGRQRELRTARWLVQTLLAPPPPSVPATPATPASAPRNRAPRLAEPPFTPATLPARFPDPDRALTPLSPPEITPKTRQSQIFDSITAKLQANLDNATNIPLEIDFFKATKKHQLFYAILRQVEQLLAELRFSQVSPEQLGRQRSVLLQDLWQATILSFFGKYYAVPVQQQSVEVAAILLQSRATVQTAILDKIPLVPELFGYLLWQTPLTIDEVSQAAGTPPAIDRATALLENLTIQVACAVVQPLLNEFADHEVVKQDFYDRRLLSTRDIERFRNDLSWKYRITTYISDPQAIFESRHWLWVFTELGLQRTAIYAPRGEELDRLGGAQLAITLLWETRDAIAPRLSAAVSWVGRGVVYLLTEIIGRSIGLIGRGILKGIGDVWHDRKG